MKPITLIRHASLAALLLAAVPAVRAEAHLTEAEAKQAAIVKPVPEYPPAARQLKITGKVELEVAIDPAGKVADVKIVSGSPVLTRPCAKTVSEWQFKPIVQDGKPTRATAPLTFEFR